MGLGNAGGLYREMPSRPLPHHLQGSTLLSQGLSLAGLLPRNSKSTIVSLHTASIDRYLVPVAQIFCFCFQSTALCSDCFPASIRSHAVLHAETEK
jgi:hypothetical protein